MATTTVARGAGSGAPAKRKAPFPVELYRSALGKKYVMAITGIMLMGFVFAHMVGNLKMYLGAEEFNHYVQGGFYGHPWIVGNRVPRLEYRDRPDIATLAAKTTPPEYMGGAHWANNGWCFATTDLFGASKGDAFIAFGNTRPLEPTKVSCPSSSAQARKVSGGKCSMARASSGSMAP